MKKILTWIIVVLVVAGIAFVIFERRERRQAAAISMEEIQPQRRNIKALISATAEVKPQNRVAIKSPIAGRIEDVLAREGTNVVKGQLLAWVSSSERAALIDAARARGPEELEHWEQLYRPSPLVAPLDGQIISRKVEPGQTVSGADELLILADRLIVAAQVDETDLAQIRLGQRVEITLDAYPNAAMTGHVDHIAYEAVTVNNVTMYRIEVLPESIPEFLRSGMTAGVAFEIASVTDVLALPVAAVRNVEGQPMVLRRPRAGGDGVMTNAVVAGLSDGKWIEVSSGLSDNDRVLAPGFHLAQDPIGPKKNPFLPFGRRQAAGSATNRGDRAPAGSRARPTSQPQR